MEVDVVDVSVVVVSVVVVVLVVVVVVFVCDVVVVEVSHGRKATPPVQTSDRVQTTGTPGSVGTDQTVKVPFTRFTPFASVVHPSKSIVSWSSLHPKPSTISGRPPSRRGSDPQVMVSLQM